MISLAFTLPLLIGPPSEGIDYATAVQQVGQFHAAGNLEGAAELLRENDDQLALWLVMWHAAWFGNDGVPPGLTSYILGRGEFAALAAREAFGRSGLYDETLRLSTLDARAISRDFQTLNELGTHILSSLLAQEYETLAPRLVEIRESQRRLCWMPGVCRVLHLHVYYALAVRRVDEAQRLAPELFDLLDRFGMFQSLRFLQLLFTSLLYEQGRVDVGLMQAEEFLCAAVQREDWDFAVTMSLRLVMFSLGLGRPHRALHCSRAARALARTHSDDALLVESLMAEANSLLDVGQARLAVAVLERAGRVDGAGARRSMILRAQAESYLVLREFDRAVERVREAMQIAKARGDLLEVAECRAVRARIDTVIEGTEGAATQLSEAISSLIARGQLRSAGVHLQHLSGVMEAAGRYEEALDLCERAHQLMPMHSSVLAANHGYLLALLERDEESRAEESRSLDLLQDERSSPAVLDTLNYLARAANLRGEIERGLDFLIRASRHVDALDSPVYQRALYMTMTGHYSMSRMDREALDCAHLFIQEQIQGSTDSLPEHFAMPITDREWWLVAFVAESTMRLQDDHSEVVAEGFHIAETLRARSLKNDLEGTSPSELRERHPRIMRRSADLRREIERSRVALTQEEGVDPSHRSVRDLLDEQLEEYHELELLLRTRNPERRIASAQQPVSLHELQQKIIAPDEALVSYVVADSLRGARVTAWVVTNDGARVFGLGSNETVQATFEEFRQAIRQRSEAYREPAHQLYRELVEPLRDQLKGRTTWVIVPSGFLGLLPFEALLTASPRAGASDREQPFLIRDVEIQYAPMAAIAKTVRESSRGPAQRALLLGDGFYERESERESSPTLTRALRALDPTRQNRLRHTRDEVLGIARILDPNGERPARLDVDRDATWKTDRFDLLLGRDIDEQVFQRDLRAYSILHFALHGTIDNQFPWFSGLLLKSHPPTFLTLMEIGGLELDADLVFLAACSTAQGAVLSSEGVRSVARAFLQAGAYNVVATQWEVDDLATSRLTPAFYQHFVKGAAPAMALHRAKLSLLDHDEPSATTGSRDGIPNERPRAIRTTFSHPYYWAPFVLWRR